MNYNKNTFKHFTCFQPTRSAYEKCVYRPVRAWSKDQADYLSVHRILDYLRDSRMRHMTSRKRKANNPFRVDRILVNVFYFLHYHVYEQIQQ